MRTLACTLAVLVLSNCGSDGEAGITESPAGAHESETGDGPPPEIERPYDEGADAQTQIDAAIASGREDGKRVLLVFGANWCQWCRRLDWVFQNDRGVSQSLEASFHVVHIDVGPRRSSTNRSVAERYGDPISNGLPCLVVLDEEGGVAHVQETGSLETGNRHDPQLVLAFLDRWSAAG